MRSAVVLLGFLLASAQAFYVPAPTRSALAVSHKPSFVGQACAGREQVSRSTLRASLEDIERQLFEKEMAKVAAKKQGSKVPAPAPAPKAVAPAPKPVPKPAPGEQQDGVLTTAMTRRQFELLGPPFSDGKAQDTTALRFAF